MFILLTGKEEIICLLTKVIEKFESQEGIILSKNSNRRNYDLIAIKLSEISNQLPNTHDTLNHQVYPKDLSPESTRYPSRKYDITGNQIKDAYYHQIISKPRPFLVDACYIYLYGVGRKGFEMNPVDKELIQEIKAPEKKRTFFKFYKRNTFAFLLTSVLMFLLILGGFFWAKEKSQWERLKKDLNITSYQPTSAEIDSLEGIWVSYIGSPQVRPSDPNRYHLIAQNVVDIRFQNGYFKIKRYGANFDFKGYAQFESPWVVSLHTYLEDNSKKMVSPRHSLMRLDQPSSEVLVISASWNFDIDEKNDIIGIREVYVKQGQGGKLEEVINTVENSSCQCKIIRWTRPNGKQVDFRLKNQRLEQLSNKKIHSLINEQSILNRDPSINLLSAEPSK